MFIVVTIAVVILALLSIWVIVGYLPTRGIEMPDYDVVEQRDGYEIRRYEPMILAQVYIEGEYGESLNRGFGKLAGYIFAQNRAEEPSRPEVRSGKIPMTSPVLTAENGAGYSIGFVMPQDYSMETLPQPADPDVTLTESPSRHFAALRFSGYATETKVRRKIDLLKGFLERDGVEVEHRPVVAQYDPPWTPPFMRRHEILITIAWPKKQ
jgi:hypothetical protein